MAPKGKTPPGEEFTEAEKAKLVEFRKRVQKIYPMPDFQLIVWLRARGLNITKAEQMLRRHLVWRKTNQLDEILDWRSTKVYAPYIHLGFDYGGAPVFLFPLGHYELRGVVECGDIVPAMRYLHQAIEYIVGLANAQGTRQATIIVDCEGFRYNQFTNRFLIQCVLELGRIVEANYPEVLKNGIVINAPRLFSPLFAIVKPVLASETISKIQIYGSDRSKWLNVISKWMSTDILPPYWGGARVGSDEFCSESWLTAPLPRYFMRRLDTVYDEYGQEWISLKIAAGESLSFDYTVTEREVNYEAELKWAFYTDGYDLGFGLTCCEDGDESGGERVIIEQKRMNSHKNKQQGSHTVTKPGKYVLKFDNSYSRTRSKVLHYVISLTTDAEEDLSIIVRTPTPSGSMWSMNNNGNSNNNGASNNGMTLSVPSRNSFNGSRTSISSSCNGLGNGLNSTEDDMDENEKEFLDAVDDGKMIGPYNFESENNNKKKTSVKFF